VTSALGLAAVTAVLRDLLTNGLIDNAVADTVGDVTVTALPPDRVKPSDATADKSQLNVFLYHVTPNTGWRNVGLPSRGERGERTSNPPLALDLHYLLTAYGAKDFHAEILLGYGMHVLHETPVLVRDAIRKALTPSPVNGNGLPPPFESLSTSELADQVEQIKITPEFLGTEEMSKLWSAFQTHYRPTAAYMASVVLVESRQPTRTPLPVRDFDIYAAPFHQPAVRQVVAESGPRDPILADSIVVVRGERLRGAVTRLFVVGEVVTPPAQDIGDTQIKLDLASLPAGALRAGVQGLQVVHEAMLGRPPQLHRTVESNVAPFVVRPVFDSNNIGVIPVPETPEVAPDTVDVELTAIDPPIGKRQRVVLLLNERNAPAGRPARSYSFRAAPRGDPTEPETVTTIKIRTVGVEAGSYLVRLQVDGAETVVDRDAFGTYATPAATFP
jgi:hypothetical protein